MKWYTESKIYRYCIKDSLIERKDRTKDGIGVQNRPRRYSFGGKHNDTIDRLSKCFLPQSFSLTEWTTTSN